jgi:hypothetical protein
MKEGRQGSGGNKVLLWGYPLFTYTLNPAWNKLVALACMIERCCCSKSWYVHFNYSFVDLTVIVRRQFRNQERKLHRSRPRAVRGSLEPKPRSPFCPRFVLVSLSITAKPRRPRPVRPESKANSSAVKAQMGLKLFLFPMPFHRATPGGLNRELA